MFPSCTVFFQTAPFLAISPGHLPDMITAIQDSRAITNHHSPIARRKDQCLTDPRNRGCNDLGCPFGCRDAHRKNGGNNRYRCAKNMNIGILPYCSLAEDAGVGIMELLPMSNARGPSILEQARLIDELKGVSGNPVELKPSFFGS